MAIMKYRILKSILGLGLIILGVASAQAQQYVWSQYAAGNYAGPGGGGSGDGAGSVARFYFPCGVALDSGGTLYVADSGNNTIRKLVFSGANCTVSTLAGTPGITGTANGTGGAAQFNYPGGIAVDAGGNLYVADTGNHTIRKITSGGAVTTLAGASNQIGSSDGTGAGALFNSPAGVAVDAGGNVYVADTGNHTIRKITSGGAVTTLAGSPNQIGASDGTGSGALFYAPGGVTVDASGNVFVADTMNHTIRKITSGGVVTTLAGTPYQYGSQDGTGIGAQFNFPGAISMDAGGNLYVADTFNTTIRKVTSSGVVTTLAGNSVPSPSTCTSPGGSSDGVGTAAGFNFPRGIAADSSGNCYVADTLNHSIRKESWTVVTTVAGSAFKPTLNNWPSLSYYYPTGVALDSGGNLYVADTQNSQILVPGGGSLGTTQSPRAQGFNFPEGVAVDSGSNIYVADTHNHAIKEIALVGGSRTTTTICGSPTIQGSVDGIGSAAMFNNPIGIAVDSGTNLYVADTYNSTIRLLSHSGTTWSATTISGSPGVTGTTEGSGSGALFSFPYGIAVDSGTNVYVADTGNNTVRLLTLSGSTWSSQTIAGTPGVTGSADGVGGAAQFCSPTGIACDTSGNLFLADTGNNSIRMLSNTGSNWVVTTVGGVPGMSGGVTGIEGIGTQALFSAPMGIVVKSGSNAATDVIYVVDSANNRIEMGSFAATGTAGGITKGSGTVSCLVNPNGLATSVYFQYSQGGPNYTSTSGTQLIGSGTNLVTVNITLGGLNSGAPYYYRMVVVNTSGTFYGAGQSFSTLPGGVPAITSATTITGTVGFPLSYTVTASNTPFSGYGLTAVPAGLVFNPLLGVITGTPTTITSTNAILSVTNAIGTGTAGVTFNIITLPRPVFTSSGSATGVYGGVFNYSIGANNSTTSYNASGLPAGWTVDSSTGLISGTALTPLRGLGAKISYF